MFFIPKILRMTPEIVTPKARLEYTVIENKEFARRIYFFLTSLGIRPPSAGIKNCNTTERTKIKIYESRTLSHPLVARKIIRIPKRKRFEIIMIFLLGNQSAKTPASGATSNPGSVDKLTRMPILTAESFIELDIIPSCERIPIFIVIILTALWVNI